MTARPWRHPDTGVFYLRKAVPTDLRAVLKKREEKLSLGTRDPVEAKRLHASALADVEQRWANARRPNSALSEREAHEIAAKCVDELLLRFADDPAQFPAHLRLAPSYLAALTPGMETEQVLLNPFRPELSNTAPRTFTRPAQNAYLWCRKKAAEYASQQGLTLDSASEVKLIKAIGNACGVAGSTLEDRANAMAIFAGQAKASQQVAKPTASTQPAVTITALFQGWAAERRPVAKTAYMWERVCASFADFVGHDDARAITKSDVIRFKDSLVAANLAPKTIREGKLAPLRAIFAWGLKNDRIPTNPAAGVDIAVKYKAGDQRRGFNDAEASTILKAASKHTGMLKWVPWLCAYSGARLSEIAQLRKFDVVDIEGFCCIRLAPEAGSLKNRASERVVPVIQRSWLSASKSSPLR